MSITTENSQENGIDVDALTQAIDLFAAAMHELSGWEGKEIKMILDGTNAEASRSYRPLC
jgi:hypothetical protein